MWGSEGCVFAPAKREAGPVVTAQGELAARISFIRKGIVGLSTVSPKGDEHWSAVRGPRSLLGLEALEGLSSSYEVRALTELELCAAPVSTVTAWLETLSGARTMFGLALAELLNQRRDIEFHTGTAEVRVARFCLACEPLLTPGGGHDHFSKVQVAALIGVRPETLSRVLRKFADAGLLDSSSGVRIIDRAGLQAIAETGHENTQPRSEETEK